MAVCFQCGAAINADENFCGVCGSPQERDEASSSTDAAAHLQHDTYPEGMQKEIPKQERPTSMSSQRGTDELNEDSESSSRTSPASGTASRRSKPKALEAGKVLTHRYEIVRRIGGGGMGAVYLAKDRNLGDAPRAVKEMIEFIKNNRVHLGFLANGERRKSAVALRDRDKFRAGREGRCRRAPGSISRWNNYSTTCGSCLLADVGVCSITQIDRDQTGFFLRGSR